MKDKKTITSFILSILVQILNFAISCINGKSKNSDSHQKHDIEFKNDENENKDTASKINDFIKNHTVRN